MTRTMLGLVAFVMLSFGCGHPRAIPNPSVPHRLAKGTKGVIWVRLPDGSLTREKVEIPQGWWVASPIVVEAQP